MSDRWLFYVTFGSALGCGLIAEAFFAFSSFAMKALGRIPAPRTVAALAATAAFTLALLARRGA